MEYAGAQKLRTDVDMYKFLIFKWVKIKVYTASEKDWWVIRHFCIWRFSFGFSLPVFGG